MKLTNRHERWNDKTKEWEPISDRFDAFLLGAVTVLALTIAVAVIVRLA